MMIYSRESLRREQRVHLGTRSRYPQAPFNISFGLDFIQRIKPRTKSNPLLELPKSDRIKFLIKFGLTDQCDLQQLILGRLQIREKTYLFKYFGRQMVRFVHDENRSQFL